MINILFSGSHLKKQAVKMVEKRFDLFLIIKERTKYLSENCKIIERLFHIQHDLNEVPKCVVCQTSARFIKTDGKYCYSKTCSKACHYIHICKISKPKIEDKRLLINAKIKKALSIVGKDGLTSSQRGAAKANITKIKRNIKVKTNHLHTAEVREKIRKSNIGNLKLSAATKNYHNKIRNTFLYDERLNKIRKTRELRGDWISFNEKDEYLKYRKKVRQITNCQPIHILLNFEKRGRGKNKFHLDHKIPIVIGFKNKIDPLIIGDIRNLQFISEYENCVKSHRISQNEISKILSYFHH
jgi:hypothetical protein